MLKLPTTSRIDESSPHLNSLAAGTEYLIVENPFGFPLDEKSLRSALAGAGFGQSVASLEISAGSQLESTWPASFFPNLQVLFLAGRRLQHMHELYELRKLRSLKIFSSIDAASLFETLPKLPLKHLTVVGVTDVAIPWIDRCQPLEMLELADWPRMDLTGLSHVSVRLLRVTSNALLRGCGSHVSPPNRIWFQDCPNLRDLSGVVTESVEIEDCQRLDLAEIAHIKGLRRAAIRGHQHISSFDFVLRCPLLEELTIAATKTTARDFRAFVESASLRTIIVYSLPDEAVRMVGRAKPNVHISNGRVTFDGGVAVKNP
jgi:hypothetical protein